MPREGHGSRNIMLIYWQDVKVCVMPREGHGSRNLSGSDILVYQLVMPREGHGSRNPQLDKIL